jgi:hypothetical protein
MTKEELAAALGGRECKNKITPELRGRAKESGLVVVYGASDDLMEFSGAIDDEINCYNGGVAYLDESGLWENKCDDDDCPYAAKERANCKIIRAVWHDGGNPCWTYETEIPHAKFRIYEDKDIYCVGIVFDTKLLSIERE